MLVYVTVNVYGGDVGYKKEAPTKTALPFGFLEARGFFGAVKDTRQT